MRRRLRARDRRSACTPRRGRGSRGAGVPGRHRRWWRSPRRVPRRRRSGCCRPRAAPAGTAHSSSADLLVPSPSLSTTRLFTRAGQTPPRTASPRASAVASFCVAASPAAARGQHLAQAADQRLGVVLRCLAPARRASTRFLEGGFRLSGRTRLVRGQFEVFDGLRGVTQVEECEPAAIQALAVDLGNLVHDEELRETRRSPSGAGPSSWPRRR